MYILYHEITTKPFTLFIVIILLYIDIVYIIYHIVMVAFATSTNRFNSQGVC